ncbi:MAG: methyltransferase domain-containing protein [Gemmatimonadota bacterium]
MTCAHCQGAGRVFGRRVAAAELRRFRKRGLRPTSRELVEGLAGIGVPGRTLLDIGGGVGAVQLALFERGLAEATSVDASAGYVQVAQDAALEAGVGDRVEYRRGDFVDLAGELGDFDLVSLDRVVCCYPDPERLLSASAARTRRRLGLVWPLDRWWVRLALGFVNLYLRATRNPFRVFVHPDSVVDESVRSRGLARVHHARRGLWQVAIYARPDPEAAPVA